MTWEPVLAAAVSGVLALAGVVWQSRKTRHLNTSEHLENSKKLDRQTKQLKKIGQKLDRHLQDHEKGRYE
jgi:outer membrane murein-binding lipoprotein Lpp